MGDFPLPFLVALILLCAALASPCEEIAQPPWVSRAGTLRASDPALAKGKGVVEWREWSAEAFADAAKSEKPVYVFVTANWSHGGREMERTSLADPAVVQMLNASFIPIRLDRDAFPETDLRLQQTLATLKGIRGWPLNVFMSSDGAVFFGATFMALDDDIEFERPGTRTTFAGILNRWKEDGNRVSREAAAFCQTLRKNTERATLRAPIPPNVLNETAMKLQGMLDRENGGFRSAIPAQFPAPRALELCLAHHARTGDPKSLEVVELTLDRMLNGAITDQLDGSFHRFCTDRKWLSPRFEKMPLFNAEMIFLLLHTWAATGNGRYRAAAEDCLNFWLGEIVRNEFFRASIAPEARSFEDGAFYAWSLQDLEKSFGSNPSDVKLLSLYFGIGERGNQTHTAPERSVLHVDKSFSSVAREMNLGVDEIRKRLYYLRQQLLFLRNNNRPQPPRDRTPLCDSNAMLAAAFLEGGRLLGRDDFLAQGLKTLNSILIEDTKDGPALRPVRHVLTEPSSVPLAMDEASRAFACLQAHEFSGDRRYLQFAADAIERLDTKYRDLLKGGYIERSFKGAPDFAPALNWRTKSFQDTSEPSTNGFIAQLHLRMFALSGERKYLDSARAAVEAVAAPLNNPSPYVGTLALAADAIQNGILTVKIIGKASDANVAAMLSLAHARYFPWKIVTRHDTLAAANEPAIPNLDPTKSFAIIDSEGRKTIAESPEELNKLLIQATKPK